MMWLYMVLVDIKMHSMSGMCPHKSSSCRDSTLGLLTLKAADDAAFEWFEMSCDV